MTIEATPALVHELLDAMPDGLLIVDSSGQIVLANHQVEDIFGYPRDALNGQSIEVLVPHEDRDQHQAHRLGYAKAPRVRAMGVAQQLSGQRADGSRFPVEVSLSPTTLDSGEAVVIAMVRDVTERTAAAEALALARRRGALLADRERMARDLHDTVIQELFATGMHLQATLPMIGQGEGADRVSEAVDAIDDTIKHVRETIFGLTTERTLELRERVEDVVRSFDTMLPRPAQLTLSGDLREVDEQIMRELVPTLREALTNAAKHAQASSVRVVVATDEDALQLEVRDDGVGITDEALRGGSGKGISNLTERAKALGGEFHIAADEAGGSAVVWRVPLVQ